MSTTMNQKQFAEYIDVAPGYVTKLKKAGRLVMNRYNRVMVDESIKRIEETRDPNRDDVVRRNAERRAAQEAEVPPEVVESHDYQAARARKEHYLAGQAELEYRHRAGELLEADDVARLAADVGTLVRTTLEAMPDRLAPDLAHESDQHRIHALLTDDIEHLLNDMARRLADLARRPQENAA